MPYRKNKSISGKRVRPFSSDIEDLIIEEVQYGQKQLKCSNAKI